VNILGLVAGAIKPVADIFVKRTERKAQRDALNAKVGMAKQEGADKVTLTDADFESISKQAENETWKDEYLTIIIPSPIVLFLVGGIYAAFTGDLRIIEGTVTGIQALGAVGVDMGFLMEAVVLAGVSLKIWRSA